MFYVGVRELLSDNCPYNLLFDVIFLLGFFRSVFGVLGLAWLGLFSPMFTELVRTPHAITSHHHRQHRHLERLWLRFRWHYFIAGCQS